MVCRFLNLASERASATLAATYLKCTSRGITLEKSQSNDSTSNTLSNFNWETMEKIPFGKSELKDPIEIKKVSPPPPFTVVKGALDRGGPVLRRTHGNEEIGISVMRLANIIPGGVGEEEEDGINQLFLHVDISKESLHFLCGLYPDALGIHSVSLRSKTESSGFLAVPTNYSGPVFQDIDEKMRDALHSFIEERGINESLFPFLQAWLYVKGPSESYALV